MAQLTQCFDHGVISFRTSITFHALSAAQTDGRYIGSYLTLELVDERGFSDSGLPTDKDDLPLATQYYLQAHTHLGQGHIPTNQFAEGLFKTKRRVGRHVFDGSDELIPPPRQGFDKKRILRTVLESATNAEDVTFQHLWLDESVGPQSVQQFILGHQPSRVLYEILQDRESLRRQANPLVVSVAPAAPETFVDRVQAERRKLLHACPGSS